MHGKLAPIETHMALTTEAAEILGVSRYVISKEIAAGRLSTIRIGDRDWIPRIEIERRRDEIAEQLIAARGERYLKAINAKQPSRAAAILTGEPAAEAVE